MRAEDLIFERRALEKLARREISDRQVIEAAKNGAVYRGRRR
jgi:hypothetical protein